MARCLASKVTPLLVVQSVDQVGAGQVGVVIKAAIRWLGIVRGRGPGCCPSGGRGRRVRVGGVTVDRARHNTGGGHLVNISALAVARKPMVAETNLNFRYYNITKIFQVTSFCVLSLWLSLPETGLVEGAIRPGEPDRPLDPFAVVLALQGRVLQCVESVVDVLPIQVQVVVKAVALPAGNQGAWAECQEGCH